MMAFNFSIGSSVTNSSRLEDLYNSSEVYRGTIMQSRCFRKGWVGECDQFEAENVRKYVGIFHFRTYSKDRLRFCMML